MRLDPQCTRCRLFEKRTQVVPPDGPLGARIVFVGEGPGEKEDIHGRPFIGRAGKMLDRLLSEQGVPRSEIMVTNTVKCRPPENRRPKEDEMRACFPYLEQELEGRTLIIALGKTSSENLLARKVNLAREANAELLIQIMGKGVRVIPAYHPSACLYNLKARQSLGQTMHLVREELDRLRSASSTGT